MLATYFALGLLYAVNALAGEAYHRQAFSQPNVALQLLYAIRAESVFPLASYIRKQPAMYHAVLDRIPPQIALIEINRALAGAPDDGMLLFWRAVQLMRAGDYRTARKAVDRLRVLLPEWALTRSAEALLEEGPDE